MSSIAQMLTNNKSTSLFADTYTAALERAMNRTSKLAKALATAVPEASCGLGEKGLPNPNLNPNLNPLALTLTLTLIGLGKKGLSGQLKQVAMLIKKRAALGHERASFFVSQGGWDTHGDSGAAMSDLFVYTINPAIRAFVCELKAQGVWDDVALVTLSEFGRTIVSNGRGTDHGWGGNIMLMGGKVKGGQILGKYPRDLTSESDSMVGGRGRVIPTHGWESVWHGLLQWLGVKDNEMDQVLPNKPNFQGNPKRGGTYDPSDFSQLFTQNDFFKN